MYRVIASAARVFLAGLRTPFLVSCAAKPTLIAEKVHGQTSIAVARFAGLGDHVMTLPLIRSLLDSDEDCNITFFSGPPLLTPVLFIHSKANMGQSSFVLTEKAARTNLGPQAFSR